MNATLALFIAFPLVCGIASAALGKRSGLAARVSALAGSLACLLLALGFWLGGPQIARLELPWIPMIGASFSLKLDGLSLPFLALSGLLGAAAVLASWKGIAERVPAFHFSLSLTIAGINGVFLASDLFLFAFMWELMLVPMFFVIDIWGHEGRHRAAVKFFIFTQAGGLLMIASIAGLYAAHGTSTGEWSFAYDKLLESVRSGTIAGPLAGALSPTLQFLLMLGFFAGFAVKLPALGLHAWLPDAHTEAPTAGSILLAGLLLKTGGYGIIRFAIPLFPEASIAFAPVAMWIGAAGIVYGGIMALGQSDMKRLVAYSSVSHLGFVLVGLYSMDVSGRNGAVIQMLSHGLSTGALFMLVGALQDRIHTRELSRMGGLAAAAPRLGALGLALALALLGLPGLGNFVGELLVLFAAFKASPGVAIAAGLGLIVAMAYALRMFLLAFHGEAREKRTIADLGWIETGTIGLLLGILLVIGLYPRGVLALLSGVAP